MNLDEKRKYQTDEESMDRDISSRSSTSHLHMKLMGFEIPRESIEILNQFNKEFTILKKMTITG